jgi:hypothetical protein
MFDKVTRRVRRNLLGWAELGVGLGFQRYALKKAYIVWSSQVKGDKRSQNVDAVHGSVKDE